MDKENQLDKDLKAAAEKKDKALSTDPNVKEQLKIGLEYRKDQGMAVLKDKTKKFINKGKKIKKSMVKQYGKKKGEAVFYAMENSGKLKGVKKKNSRNK